MRTFIFCVVLVLGLAACGGGAESTIAFANLPESGNAINGEALFASQRCTACHNEGASGAPTLENFGEYAGSVVAGQTAREYAFYSIVEPAQHIAEGYGNAMPNNYDESMTAQEIADLVTYLLRQ